MNMYILYQFIVVNITHLQKNLFTCINVLLSTLQLKSQKMFMYYFG